MVNIGKFIVERKLIIWGFFLEVLSFVASGFLIHYNIFASLFMLALALLWAFIVGEGIKYKVRKNGN